ARERARRVPGGPAAPPDAPRLTAVGRGRPCTRQSGGLPARPAAAVASAMADGEHLVKLLLLGDSAVGKSSLLVRLCDGKFDSNFVLTIGAFWSGILDRHRRAPWVYKASA
ncbi:unnamed protein product, partial [Prorocentrum cordatum]